MGGVCQGAKSMTIQQEGYDEDAEPGHLGSRNARAGQPRGREGARQIGKPRRSDD